MKFTAKNQVRLHDTDMAQILYYPRQFRFVQDTWEDLMQSEGITYEKIFKSRNAFVVVHAEADYKIPLKAGDHLIIDLIVDNIGNSSFTLFFELLRGKECIGTARIIHVCIDTETKGKIPIPSYLRAILEKYQ